MRQPDGHILGFPVYINPLLDDLAPPKISISPDFKWCSDEFRAKHNAWLLERFGREEFVCIKTASCYFVNKATFLKLKSMCSYPV